MQEITTFALYIIPDSLNNTLDLHMKQIYIILLAAALCVPGAPAASRFKTKAGKRAVKTMVQKAPAGTWRPASVTEYNTSIWDDNVWVEYSTTLFTYDTRGNVTKEYKIVYGDSIITLNTYDELNRIITTETTDYDDGSIFWAAREEYTWDPIVHDFCISLMNYRYDNGEWILNGNNETNTITRDEAGNVTEVVHSYYYDGSNHPNDKFIWTYGKDGKANALALFDFNEDNNDWELIGAYSNIEWERTNGQLLSDDITDYLEGANRISRLSTPEYDGSESICTIEYDTNKPGEYYFKTTDPNYQLGRIIRKKFTDDYGSYTITDKIFSEYIDENGNKCEDHILDQDKTVATYNESHNITELTVESYESLFSDPRLDVTRTVNSYDFDGNLAESIEYRFCGSGEYDEIKVELAPYARFVYGPYNDVTNSISTIKVSDIYPAVVFNAQGIAVKTINSESELNSLPAGFYIVNGRKYVRR